MQTFAYKHPREHLAEIWDQLENGQTPVRIRRRGHEDHALIPVDELPSLRETVHLLRSPKNAARLLTALARSTRKDSWSRSAPVESPATRISRRTRL
jgi:antitoxin YefM